MRHVFTGTDNFLPLSEERAARRARIAELMRSTAKASEADLPPEQRRQILDVQHTADALATGQTIEHAAAWSPWERASFCARWLGLGSALAAILLLALEWAAPWS